MEVTKAEKQKKEVLKNKSHIRKSTGEHIFDVCNITFMIIIMFVMLYPFWNTVIVSFNDARDSIRGSLFFLPRIFTLYNYEVVFNMSGMVQAAGVSVARTVLGVITNVVFSALLAYVLSVKTFVFRRFLNLFLVLTMYVNAGLIPGYMLLRSLGLLGTFWLYIIPTMVGAFNVIIIRTYISGLPDSYAEAAKIEGAGELRIFFTIIFPLCMPVIATVSLWVAVGQWNSWFDTYLFNRGAWSTLQFEMMKILSDSMSTVPPPIDRGQGQQPPMITPNSLRAAITVVCTVPILVVYPFLQKYFVKGVHIGGVKG